MIENIEIKAGNAARQEAASLLTAAFPPGAAVPWRDFVWATPDRGLLAFNRDKEVICHVGIVLRGAAWNDRAVKIGGLGGVTTRQDCRRQGVASAVMRRATQEIRGTFKADFGLLFCEPRNSYFYTGLGWQPFKGDVLVMQTRGQVRFNVLDPYVFALKIAPGTGVLDLRGPPW
jgi:aminoglycoside 2'-N-acetyltransferase I